MPEEEKKVTLPEGDEEKKTEDPKDEVLDAKLPEGEPDESPKPSAAEIKARAYGWVPEEEFSGDKSRWVDAKEFVSRAPLFDRIDHYRKRVETLEGTVQDIKKHYKKVDETAYKRAIVDLKKEKVQALEDENHARVVELDDALLDLKTEQKEAKQQDTGTPQSGPSDTFQSWARENSWYDSNPTMRDMADDIGRGFFERTGKSEPEILRHVAAQIRQIYPDSFQNPSRAKPNSVEGTRPAPAKKKKPGWSDLSDQQKEVATKFVKSGIMTREKYVEDLHKIGEI